jgi:tetratricopeptide (TPR) repeat protein
MKPFATLFLLTGIISAQVYTPPAPSAPSSAPDTTIVRPKETQSKSPLGEELPMLDPAAETITLGGVTIPLGDNRIMKARFEKYLSQPPESSRAASEYRAKIKEILDTISPFRSQGPNLVQSFRLLPSAGTYPGDANICGSLAESIYVAMLAKKDVNGLKLLNDSIEQEKQRIIRDGDWAARHDTSPTLGAPIKAGAGGAAPGGAPAAPSKPTENPGAGTESLQYANTLRRIGEIELLKKANIARTEVQTIQTKAQYQVNMVQWFVQRRYEHVLMAARFYNQIWKDGDSTLRIDKNSDVAKLFSESAGVNPTVSSLDSLSNEAIHEVDNYIEAFDLMLSRNELHSASQRLMEAYMLGEYLSPLATLSQEKKLRVATYFHEFNELYGALQAHDYTKAKELVTHLKATAQDFPSSKFDSAIAGYSLASDLAIEEAKAHLFAKNNDKATEKFKAALEIWPSNPKLDEFRKLMNNLGPAVVLRNDFDRLLSEGSYREIFKRQYELAPAIQGDAGREEAFKQVIGNLTKIEAAIGKASEFSKMGQSYAAYEQLAELRETFTDDAKLGRELELLAPKVADFTKAIDRAHQFEERTPKQTGSALSWYLKARNIFPQSKFAEQGVKRVVSDILPKDPATSSAEASE